MGINAVGFGSPVTGAEGSYGGGSSQKLRVLEQKLQHLEQQKKEAVQNKDGEKVKELEKQIENVKRQIEQLKKKQKEEEEAKEAGKTGGPSELSPVAVSDQLLDLKV